MEPNLVPNLVRFGVFELDLRARELRKNGLGTGLPEQSIKILALLTDKPGDVVLREEIRRKLWPNDTVVEFSYSGVLGHVPVTGQRQRRGSLNFSGVSDFW